MTCIAAIRYNDVVYMAADSACSIDYAEIFSTNTPKMFKTENILIAGSGSWRVGQAIQKYWNPRPFVKDLDDGKDLYESGIIDSLIEACESGKVLKEDDESKDICIPADFLLAYKNRLWYICEDFGSIQISFQDYFAIGSGAKYALGSLFSTHQLMTPESYKFKLKMALAAALEYGMGIKEPIIYMDSKHE